MAGALEALTVLDLSEYIAGPYATKLLADYGANVIKLERPGGDPSRKLGPFKGGTPHPERSGTFFFFNTNKRSIVVDLKQREGKEVFLRLADRADVVVEGFRPGVLDRLGVGWETIHAHQPSAALVSITNFGQTGPYREFRASELVLFGYAGEMYSMGVEDREPVKMYGTAALVESGSAAATAILGAAMAGQWQGVGQHVDFALADAQLCGVDRRHSTVIAHQYSGRKTQRAVTGAIALAVGAGIDADGYVNTYGAGIRMERLAQMMGDPEWLKDPKWYEPTAALNPDLIAEFDSHFFEWLISHTRREVWAAARRAEVLCGPLFTVEDLFTDEHFQARGVWVEARHSELGQVTLPGRPFILSDAPWELRRAAPLLGEHTASVLREAGYSQAQVAKLADQRAVEVR